MSDWDPTGYYARKAIKNAETIDALIVFYKWGAIICLIVLVADLSLN